MMVQSSLGEVEFVVRDWIDSEVMRIGSNDNDDDDEEEGDELSSLPTEPRLTSCSTSESTKGDKEEDSGEVNAGEAKDEMEEITFKHGSVDEAEFPSVTLLAATDSTSSLHSFKSRVATVSACLSEDDGSDDERVDTDFVEVNSADAPFDRSRP